MMKMFINKRTQSKFNKIIYAITTQKFIINEISPFECYKQLQLNFFNFMNK